MVWENISSTVQTGTQADQVSYTISTVSCLGVKRSGLDVKYSPPSGAEINKVYSYASASIACLHGRLKNLSICSFNLFVFIFIYLYYLFIFICLLIYIYYSFICLYLFIIYLYLLIYLFISLFLFSYLFLRHLWAG